MEKYKEMVHKLYWEDDLNCATTILMVLADRFNVNINRQVIQGLIGIPGAAKNGSLCGLVSGGIVFIGIYGSILGIEKDEINMLCQNYSEGFIRKFRSIECSILRPEGFNKDNPPHLCENLTKEAVIFAIDFADGINQNYKIILGKV